MRHVLLVLCVLVIAAAAFCLSGCSAASPAARDAEYQKVVDLEAKMKEIIDAAHAFDVITRTPATQPASTPSQ